MRGCVSLPARRLDSFSNPCLLRTSAVLVCTLGDLPLWAWTTCSWYHSPLHSSLVITPACCSSARTGIERREGTGKTIINQHTHDREYSYHKHTHTHTHACTHAHTHTSGVRGAHRCEGLVTPRVSKQEVKHTHYITHRKGENRSVKLLGPLSL